MAENGREKPEQLKNTDSFYNIFHIESPYSNQVDKEERLRILRERQNEERQRKLEEIRAQALAAQQFKEQKEQERKRRLEELRVKDDTRRQQVEERKRAINEAERDRLESILKRNQEREARIEAKRRNERSSIVFAFGSSTPRLLDPVDSTALLWGQRRATSTQNIPMSTSVSLTRRQSERDLDFGNKKRATSAGGLERSVEGSIPTTPAGCVSGYVGRRRTDLVPTIPSKDAGYSSSRKSLNQSPGRAYSMSRLDQLAKPRKRPDLPALNESNSFSSRPLSSPRLSSVTRSMSHLAVSKGGSSSRRSLDKSDSRSMHQLPVDGLSTPRMTRATQLRQQKLLASSNSSDASSRPSSSMSQQSTTSIMSSASVRYRPSNVRRPRPASIAITGVSHDKSEKQNETKPPLPRVRKSGSKTSLPPNEKPRSKPKSPVDSSSKVAPSEQAPSLVNGKLKKDPGDKQTPKLKQKPPDAVEQQSTSEVNPAGAVAEGVNEGLLIDIVPDNEKSDVEKIVEPCNVENRDDRGNQEEVIKMEQNSGEIVEPLVPEQAPAEVKDNVDTGSKDKEGSEKELSVEREEMSTSMTKSRITTEEEAKAALAERRRLAREEAERQAEQERLRIEAEAAAELERQRKEEEQIQKLVEEQRRQENERLQEAIREAQRREEEERLRKEEEQRQKLLKEEAEKRARKEAERQKAELQERLKNEEKEREERRKRVEAIMKRTRNKNNANSGSQENAEDKNENKSENKMNGTKSEHENGTKNGKDLEIVDNIIPDESVKNANTATINSTDSINSNNAWPQQFDPLM